MKLQKFGKLIKQRYGSIGGEMLNALYEFYIENQTEFENRFDVLEEVGTKGCFLYEDKEDNRRSFIVFGLKYIDKEEGTILVKGKVMARGTESDLKVGDSFLPDSERDNQFKMLDSGDLASYITDLNLITTEKEDDDI